MKKRIFSFLIALCLILPCAMFLTACGGVEYTGLNVQCSQNLEFLVGEDYIDNQIKAVATLSDKTTEDVTGKITIDSSAYKKDVVGKYKIYFKFEEFTEEIEVSVVDKITDTAKINERFNAVIQNSFGTEDYSYEMVFTGKHNNLTFVQDVKLSVDRNGKIVSCVKWYTFGKGASSTNYIFEGWYNGTEENGVFTTRSTTDNINFEIKTESKSFADFNNEIELLAKSMELSSNKTLVLIPQEVYNLKSGNNNFSGELTKIENEYVLVTEKATYVYENNILKTLNGNPINCSNQLILTESDIPTNN